MSQVLARNLAVQSPKFTLLTHSACYNRIPTVVFHCLFCLLRLNSIFLSEQVKSNSLNGLLPNMYYTVSVLYRTTGPSEPKKIDVATPLLLCEQFCGMGYMSGRIDHGRYRSPSCLPIDLCRRQSGPFQKTKVEVTPWLQQYAQGYQRHNVLVQWKSKKNKIYCIRHVLPIP